MLGHLIRPRKLDAMRWYDVRRHGYARVAAIVPRVALSNPPKNVKEHLKLLEQAYQKGAQYVICPELGITGYSNDDLFLQQVLLDRAVEAVHELLEKTQDWDMLMSFGAPLSFDGQPYNCAVTAYRGRVLGVTAKTYLPGTGEYDELRHFASAHEAIFAEVDWDGVHIPFGNNILFRSVVEPAFVLHVEICEDGWVPIPPSARGALGGATVLANLSASDITTGKADFRRLLFQAASGRFQAAQLYCSAGFGESSTNLSWDGQAFIAERGEVLVEAPRFSKQGEYIIQDVDLLMLRADRMRQNSFRANARDYAMPFQTVEFGHEPSTQLWVPYCEMIREIPKHPFVPPEGPKRDERCQEAFLMLATALERRLESLPPGRRKIIQAFSGGEDSTLAVLCDVHAADRMGIPRSDVICLTLPGFGTTKDTKHDVYRLSKALGTTLREISIKEPVEKLFSLIGYDPRRRDVVYENCQAWQRKIIEKAVAAMEGGIVVGSSTLSELLLGYTTFLGDHASDYGVNAGVPKTLGRYLIDWAAENVFNHEEEARRVLKDIRARGSSHENLPLNDQGENLHRTEDVIGPYELHDFFGYYLLRFGLAPARVVRMAACAFRGEYTLAQIKEWMQVFLVRFFPSQFKRNCLPDGPKIGLLSVSPRRDWRMPSDADPQIWLQDLEAVPA